MRLIRAGLALAVLLLALPPEAPPRAALPAAVSGSPGARILAVPRGGSLQAALDEARPGDTVTLEPGAVYRGPFTLPVKEGDAFIVVRTAALDRLPPPGSRVDPSHAGAMPTLEAAQGAVIDARPGAHHYRFVGLEIRPVPGAFLYNLVLLGANETSVEAQPRHLEFDRCYLHGDRERGTRRGIALNSTHTVVTGSWFADFMEIGVDSQAILGWNGAGPFRIEGNHLEAAGENLMFGGVDPAVRGLVPADILIRGNVFAKPLTWKADDPAYAGRAWTVKNLLELKNARRVTIEGNLFERNWAQAQNGFAILFTVRNQDGAAPWAVVEDVVFRGNLVRHAGSGINILGHDDNHPSGQARRIAIRDNLFVDVGGPRWGGAGILFQLLAATADVLIEHNTALHTGNIILADGAPHTGFVFRGNVVPHNAYGVIGSGTGVGSATLATYFPGALFEGNVIVGGPAALYPPDNAFPATLEEAGLAPLARGELLPGPAPALRGRAARQGGRFPGVDLRVLSGALGLASAADGAAP